MLKAQIHIFAGGGAGLVAKQTHIFAGGGWWPTFDVESKNAEIPNSHFAGGGGDSQLLMLSPKMLKAQIHIFAGRQGGGWGGGWQPTFDAESKNAKIPNSHCCRGWGGLVANF